MDESNGNRVRAVSYLRVSSVGQIDGDGFDRQRDAISAYASRHNVDLVGEYRDEGVSGTVDHVDRDGFRELLARIAGNGVRMVLVERADRLARDVFAQETLLRALMRLGVKVIDVASGMDLTDESDPSRIMIRQLLSVVAQHDKLCLVSKLRKARNRVRARTGRCEGRKPYGYRQSERGGLERICDLAAQGMSARQIANSLNVEGVPSRGGKPWTFGSVARVVRRVQARNQTEAVAA
jgi:DNA invertase Pin-like site-specific DNA recombinase